MSIRIMSRIWEAGPTDPMQRFVLLAIADHADDHGRAYPSMIGIASKCGMTERGARGIIRKLEAGGFLETKVGGGRGGKSHYTVNPEGQTRNDIPGMSKPGTTRHETRNDTTLNPEPRSAEPSITIIKPKTRATRFDEFWEAYPHRGGVKRDRKTSEQKYDKAVKAGISEQTIIDAAKALHRDKTVISGFARDPKAWLHQEGWTEGIEEAGKEPSKSDPIERWKRIANS